MFGPGWYRNPLSQGPVVKASDGPTLTGPGRKAVDGLAFAHAAGCYGEGVSVPCFYIDVFDPTGQSIPIAAGMTGNVWYCQRYELPFDSSERAPGPVLPLHGLYPDYAINHPIGWNSDVTEHYEYDLDYSGQHGLTGYGRAGPCTLTLSGLGLDGDYTFGFAHPVTIHLHNLATGKTATYSGVRRLYPAISGIYDAPFAPTEGTLGFNPGHNSLSLFGFHAVPPHVEDLANYDYLLTGPNPPPIIRVLVGATFTAKFVYPTYINYRTGRPTPPIMAGVQIDLQPNVSDDALTVRRSHYQNEGYGVVTEDVPTYVNSYFVTDVMLPPLYTFGIYSVPEPLLLKLYPAVKYYEPFAADPGAYLFGGSASGTRAASAYYYYVSDSHYSLVGENSNAQLFGDVSSSYSGGIFALSAMGVFIDTYHTNFPHDADIAITVAPSPVANVIGFNTNAVFCRTRWIWTGPIHITGHLSDHDTTGTSPAPPPADTDLSDKGALDQDPATGRVYLAKVIGGQLQIAAREGWQGLGGAPARDYAPLLGPGGAAVTGKAPHLASRTAGGDAARGGLTTLVYQDAGGHVVLAISGDGLHTVGAPTMPIFTETGGLPCHLHDESTGLTYVAASFAVAPPANSPAGTVSTTEDLRLVRLGANLAPVAWADGKLEKLIKAGSPKAGRPSLTQNRFDPEQPLLLIHGDKKYLGSQGGEKWAEVTN